MCIAHFIDFLKIKIKLGGKLFQSHPLELHKKDLDFPDLLWYKDLYLVGSYLKKSYLGITSSTTEQAKSTGKFVAL